MKNLKSIILILSILCYVPTSVLGQNAEKDVKYAGIDGCFISKRKFKKCIRAGFLRKTVENEDSIVHYLSQNSFEGKLTSVEDKQIRLMLEKIVGKEIDSNRAIVIHLYNKNDDQLVKDINNKRYWDWLEKNPNRIEALLIGNKDSGITPNPKNHVYFDSYNFLNNTFFNKSDLDYNHISIKPDGSYRIFLGKHNTSEVLDWSI